MLESNMENIKSKIEAKLERRTLSQVLVDLQETVEYTTKFLGKIDRQDLNTLLKAFKLLKENRELLDAIHKVVDAQYEQFSKSIIPEVFELLEIDSVKMHGRNFIKSARTHWSIKNENRDLCLGWLRDNGFSSLIKEDVNAKTLSSALNEKLEEEAITPPQGLFNSHSEDYIQVRKS